MSLIQVDEVLCRKDGICMRVCPKQCLVPDAEGRPVADPESACIDCGHCEAVCPHGALRHTRLATDGFVPARIDAVAPEALAALMRSRRSVRAYKPDTLDRTVLETLLETARYAPTGVNAQEVCWNVLSGPQACRDLAGLVVDWMRANNVMPLYIELWDKGQEVVLRGAPHVAVAHAPKDALIGSVDCVIAATYMELAAASMGLGACWAGILMFAARNHPPVAKALGIPEGNEVHAGLMLGRPQFRYTLAPPRKPLRVAWL
ncbi:nitroreductase family protein [Fundidesulfovibrio agrisoli]|uniref:nitroreductase family protein n=1 Tax=Fundidesulfovibrio agrisoli TaxID=2922717 RepID=UPI001FAE6F7B|nr:nitroreductase family protein [Fundidesulfovibrio agrisoli]